MAEKAKFLFQIKQTGAEKVSNKVKHLKGDVNGLTKSVKRLAVVFGAGFLGKQLFDIGRGAINTAAQFETLRVRLGNMYGSVQRGTQAFDAFNKVAATTPFQLQNVVEAGAALKAFGADAEEMIKPVSDLAAFMGVDVVDAANAMGRAFAGGAGAADVLREKGILQLIKDTQGFADLTKLTLPEFRDAMVKTLSDPEVGIAGATTKLADTWNGAVSNFQDGIDRLKAAIGDKLIEALRPSLDAINKELSKMGAIGWGNIAQSLQDNFGIILDSLGILAGGGGQIIGLKLLNGFQFMIGKMLPTTASSIATAFGSFFPFIHDAIENALVAIAPSLDESLITMTDYSDIIKGISDDVAVKIKANYDKIIEDAQTYNNQKKELKEAETKIEEDGNKKTDKEIKHSLETRLKVGSNLIGSLAAMNKSMSGSAKVTARMQQTQAIIDTYSSATAAMAPVPKGYGSNPVGWAAAATAIAMGLANVATIESSLKSFATGGSFVTSGSEAIMVGDNPSGRELVSVTQLDAGGDPTSVAGAININISGNVMSEGYTEDIIIPQIKEALRRGEDLGIS